MAKNGAARAACHPIPVARMGARPFRVPQQLKHWWHHARGRPNMSEPKHSTAGLELCSCPDSLSHILANAGSPTRRVNDESRATAHKAVLNEKFLLALQASEVVHQHPERCSQMLLESLESCVCGASSMQPLSLKTGP